MNRRVSVVLGILLLLIAMFTSGAQILHWRGTLSAHPDGVEQPVVNSSELPRECQRFAHELTAGRPVSTEGYRITLAGTTVIVKRTNISQGWQLGDAYCIPSFTFSGTLHVEGQYYDIDGRYQEGNVHKLWRFGRLGILVGLAGIILLVIGVREFGIQRT